MTVTRRTFLATTATAGATAAPSALAAGQTAVAAQAATLTAPDPLSPAFRQTGAAAVVRNLQDRLLDSVSVFDFMSPAQIVDVRAGKRQLDVTDAIQAAVTASGGRRLTFPSGGYVVSRKITLPTSIELIGEHELHTSIHSSSAGIIFEFPYLATKCSIRSMSFGGNGATGVAVASGGGPFHDYLVEFTIENCHFSWNMSFGIFADLIFGRLRSCSFGTFGEGAPGTTLVGIRCYGNGQNYANVNLVETCNFQHCHPSNFAIDISKGGSNWIFSVCNFDSNGRCVRLDNISLVRFDNCWFEGNASPDYVVSIGACASNIEFRLCNFVNNRSPSLIDYSSNVTHGISFDNCTFGIAGNGHIIYDNATKSTNLQGNGSIVFKDPKVSGGSPALPITSALNRGGVNHVRAWAVVNTAGLGSIVAASDPGIEIGRRNGPGDVSLVFPYPLASTAAGVCCVATGTSGSVSAFAQGSTQNIRIQAFGRSGGGAAVDDVVKVLVLGI